MDFTKVSQLGSKLSMTPPSAQQEAAFLSAYGNDKPFHPHPPMYIDGDYHVQKRPQHPQVHIHPITPSTVPSYRRLITVLLPIRYPDRFFGDSVADTTETALARVALWRDVPTSGTMISSDLASGKVVGGIQCRLEDPPSDSSDTRQLYIQTIAVLSPFRRCGIAANLLDTIIKTIIEHYEKVTHIYAHVWEANIEAIEWYRHRGFAIEEGVIEGYYRRLKPSGAKVVRRRIEIADHLAVNKSREG
ncbi:MAG: hypothetical protein Q9191_004763 [Dirinaria sp. TL-2023a]